MRNTIKWSYGITTVPTRRNTLLPRTLQSLKRAGFTNPRLFVDGDNDITGWQKQFSDCDITCRWPQIRAFANWLLGLGELFAREPNATVYAMFQDDFVTYPSLRQYLEKCDYPDKGYWNLYTFPQNQSLCPKNELGNQLIGWFQANQRGLGAVALVLSRKVVLDLLMNKTMIERPVDKDRGHRNIDGGIVNSLRRLGYKEYVHNPSLVQHTGFTSVIGNKKHPAAPSFKGEHFDALRLLEPE